MTCLLFHSASLVFPKIVGLLVYRRICGSTLDVSLDERSVYARLMAVALKVGLKVLSYLRTGTDEAFVHPAALCTSLCPPTYKDVRRQQK